MLESFHPPQVLRFLQAYSRREVSLVSLIKLSSFFSSIQSGCQNIAKQLPMVPINTNNTNPRINDKIRKDYSNVSIILKCTHVFYFSSNIKIYLHRENALYDFHIFIVSTLHFSYRIIYFFLHKSCIHLFFPNLKLISLHGYDHMIIRTFIHLGNHC